MLQKFTGCVCKFETLLLGISTFLNALNRCYPRWLTNKGRDMSGYWLDGRENLDSR